MQHMAISNQYHVIFRDSIKPVTDVGSSVTERISLQKSRPRRRVRCMHRSPCVLVETGKVAHQQPLPFDVGRLADLFAFAREHGDQLVDIH
jgi:hypothetical protein